jgi:exopolysaccharide biosynthesis polyprenyl glycosylphosphotransferase
MTVLETVTTERKAVCRTPVVGVRARGVPRRSRLVMMANDIVAASVTAVIVCGWMTREASWVSQRLGGASVSAAAASLVAVVFPLVWAGVLYVHRAYDRNPLALGGSLNRRIVDAALTLAALIPPVCLLVGRPGLIAPGAVVVPLTAGLTMISRKALGAWTRMLAGGADLSRTVVVGHSGSVFDLVLALRRDHARELTVAGVCLVGRDQGDLESTLEVPVTRGVAGLVSFARGLRCQTVLVAPSTELDGLRLRRLAWKLYDCGVDLVVAPSLAEAAPARITVTDVGGRLLLHVRASRFHGPSWQAKEVVDRVLASVIVCLVAPVLVAVAVAVRLSSPGPVLFRQIRVGRDGKEFVCLKFRTMRADADARRDEVAHLNERSEGLLFKIRNDPRVTRLGALLRRYSLDELPQLFNVLRGEMSLVGPRPPLPKEVAAYDEDVRRRLRVKPGITGLWQVSGRSELPWPEAVRLDLAYVDNWCPWLDLQILLRTAAAVVRGTGAY